jgi:hypothetical protein
LNGEITQAEAVPLCCENRHGLKLTLRDAEFRGSTHFYEKCVEYIRPQSPATSRNDYATPETTRMSTGAAHTRREGRRQVRWSLEAAVQNGSKRRSSRLRVSVCVCVCVCEHCYCVRVWFTSRMCLSASASVMSCHACMHACVSVCLCVCVTVYTHVVHHRDGTKSKTKIQDSVSVGAWCDAADTTHSFADAIVRSPPNVVGVW